MVDPTEFLERYEKALATQDWKSVAPLIDDNASVIFSDGSMFKGKEAIKAAYERNFNAIQNEEYRIENIHWLLKSPESAAYMFDFFWRGVVRGREASGSGRGTAVLIRKDNRWLLIAEQLGSRPQE